VKVFLDTNVLASAAATRGLCADVFRAVLAYHELVVSGQTISELQRVLRDKFGVSQEYVESFVALIQQDSTLAEPGELPDLALKDTDDLEIIAAACNAGADVLVTGDKELVALGCVGRLRIETPREFWNELTQ